MRVKEKGSSLLRTHTLSCCLTVRWSCKDSFSTSIIFLCIWSIGLSFRCYCYLSMLLMYMCIYWKCCLLLLWTLSWIVTDTLYAFCYYHNFCNRVWMRFRLYTDVFDVTEKQQYLHICKWTPWSMYVFIQFLLAKEIWFLLRNKGNFCNIAGETRKKTHTQ